MDQEETAIDIQSKNIPDATTLRASTKLYVALSLVVASCLILMALLRVLAPYGNAIENAIAKGEIEALRHAVVERDVNAVDDYGHSMLICAIRYGIRNDKLMQQREVRLKTIYSMLEILLDSGANVNALDDNNHLPLCSAVQWTDIEVVGLLIDRGANVNLQDGHGDTALHFAVRSQAPEMIALLLGKGADVDLENDMGETPRRLFARIFQSKILELLPSGARKTGEPNIGPEP